MTLSPMAVLVVLSIPGAAIGAGWQERALTGQLEPQPLGNKRLPRISGGLMQGLVGGEHAAAASSAARQQGTSSTTARDLGLSPGTLGCGARNTDGNVRVNQDCGYRPQNETIIKYDPNDPDNFVAGMNDYRTGEGFQGFAFTLDGGRTWGDGLVPFTNHRNNPRPGHTVLGGPGTEHTYEAYSDPGVTWDTRGNAFFSAVLFDRSTAAGAVAVTISPGVKGTFFNSLQFSGSRYIAAEDNNPVVLHDKPFTVADSYLSSPFRDNVYVVWTVFDFSCKDLNNNPAYCKSPIYFSRSTDHAFTWSQPVPISGNSPELCFFGNAFGNPTDLPNDCNFDQGADPEVLPDGTLVVVFNNGNTPAGNPNGQQLAVISHDAGTTWTGPVKVGDDILVGEPVCADAGGECIPGADVRTNDFPRIGVNRANGHLYVVWQDYRTGEFDIHLSGSFDGGLTWTEARAPVNPDPGRDHYFPAVDVVDRRGSRDVVAVSYFRTQRVPGENVPGHVFVLGDPGVGTSDTDYSLAGGRGLDTPYAWRRVSPETPPPSFRGFNGDYSGIAVVGRIAHPIWSDARNPAPAGQAAAGPGQDEDVFTDAVGVPSADFDHD